MEDGKSHYQADSRSGVVTTARHSLPTITKQDAVKYLPQGTREYRFQGIEETERIVDNQTSENESQYLIFSHVPPNIETQISETRCNTSKVVSSYYPVLALLILRMAYRPHEMAGGDLNQLMLLKLFNMGMHFGQLHCLTAAEVQGTHRRKKPDHSYIPVNLPPGRSNHWPTVVIETGYSESHRQLGVDASWWLGDSNRDVQMVLTIDVEKSARKVLIECWESVQTSPYATRSNADGMTAQIVQSVMVSRQPNQSQATVTAAPLIIPFQRLFLQAPTGQQADISITAGELQELAEGVWSSQGL